MSIATPPPTSLSTPSPTERDFTFEEQDTVMANRNAISTPIYLIVATSVSPPMGIGFRGSLPWGPIRSDMSFFVKATTTIAARPEYQRLDNQIALNAVVMGRKTWDSIPPRFRPLSGRLNVIISRSNSRILASKIVEELKSRKDSSISDSVVEIHEIENHSALNDSTDLADDGKSESFTGSMSTYIRYSNPDPSSDKQHYNPALSKPNSSHILISNSLESSLNILNSSASSLPQDNKKKSITIPTIFSIGGAELYRQFLNLNPNHISKLRILQTQIRKLDNTDFECDTFFPEDLESNQRRSKWVCVSQREVKEWIGIDVPQSQSQSLQQDELKEEEIWKKDEKSRTEIRVLGWERKSE